MIHCRRLKTMNRAYNSIKEIPIRNKPISTVRLMYY